MVNQLRNGSVMQSSQRVAPDRPARLLARIAAAREPQHDWLAGCEIDGVTAAFDHEPIGNELHATSFRDDQSR